MTRAKARSASHAICGASRQWATRICTVPSDHCTAPEFAAGRRDLQCAVPAKAEATVGYDPEVEKAVQAITEQIMAQMAK